MVTDKVLIADQSENNETIEFKGSGREDKRAEWEVEGF